MHLSSSYNNMSQGQAVISHPKQPPKPWILFDTLEGN